MRMQLGQLGAFALMVGLALFAESRSTSQEPAPMSMDGVPEVPRGIEVLARGPIHEAFATPTSEAKPTQAVPKQPPAPIEELPPEEKPEGDVVWVGGYWGWDDDRQDFLWVSGCWRIKPQDKEWIAGYWRQTGDQYQWVPGFWNSTPRDNRPPEVTYFPEPPAPPNVAPGAAPGPDMFYVPGYWMWTGDRYAWRAGYWNRARAGYVYIPSHYRWTPSGYVFISGYWDLAVSRRGVLYAPVYVDAIVIGPRFSYTPYYAVTDTVMLDAMFIRPASCHYYFGDYYSARYAGLGYESCFVYSRRHYEPIIVYQAWEFRDRPRWYESHYVLTVDRYNGRAPVPPRTLVQQNTVINNVTVNNVTKVNNVNVTTNNIQKTAALAPAKSVLAARGEKTVALDATARTQVRASTQATQQAVTQQRRQSEQFSQGANSARPRVASFNVPTTPPVTKTGGAAPIRGPHPSQPISNPIAKNPGISTNPTAAAGQAKAPGTNQTPGFTKVPPNPVGGAGAPGFTRVPSQNPAGDSGAAGGQPKYPPGNSGNPQVGGQPPRTEPMIQPVRPGPPPRPAPPRKDENKKKAN